MSDSGCCRRVIEYEGLHGQGNRGTHGGVCALACCYFFGPYWPIIELCAMDYAVLRHAHREVLWV